MKQSLCLDNDGSTIETSDRISFNFPTGEIVVKNIKNSIDFGMGAILLQ